MSLIYKTNFLFGALIKSAEVNSNFIILRDQNIYNEDHTGDINGIIVDFVMAHNFKPGSVRVYVDGIRQLINYDYREIAPNIIHIATGDGLAPNAVTLVTGQDLVLDYVRSDV